jgi:hypothetical protein
MLAIVASRSVVRSCQDYCSGCARFAFCGFKFFQAIEIKGDKFIPMIFAASFLAI